MKRILLFSAACLFAASSFAQNADSIMIRRVYSEALMNGNSYENLRMLCKKVGSRLSGSTGAEKAVIWGKQLMESYGFDRVYLQEVKVPHWVRGAKETAFLQDGATKQPLAVAALGGSVGTPAKGISAEVVEVKNFEELKQLGEAVIKGKIVFFNRAFDPKPIETFYSYGGAVNQRGQGAIEAAKYGAVAVIVRSMTHALDNNPHTGAMRYKDGVTKIPAAAISTQGAALLSARLKQRKLPYAKVFLKMSCETLPDATSFNVVGEMKGSKYTDEIISVGGHLDSWDLAEGAHDDGTGCVQSIEALRILKSLGYKPQRTIRAVLFMNEENGTRGGLKYAEEAGKLNEKHIAAIESDEGGFTPRGFSIESSNKLHQEKIGAWRKFFTPYQADEIVQGGSGTDIEPLKEKNPNIVLIGFKPDSQRYFDIHHAASDVFENVNKRELELGGAAITSLIYLLDQYGVN